MLVGLSNLPRPGPPHPRGSREVRASAYSGAVAPDPCSFSGLRRPLLCMHRQASGSAVHKNPLIPTVVLSLSELAVPSPGLVAYSLKFAV
jgi:hypothetical protein